MHRDIISQIDLGTANALHRVSKLGELRRSAADNLLMPIAVTKATEDCRLPLSAVARKKGEVSVDFPVTTTEQSGSSKFV